MPNQLGQSKIVVGLVGPKITSPTQMQIQLQPTQLLANANDPSNLNEQYHIPNYMYNNNTINNIFNTNNNDAGFSNNLSSSSSSSFLGKLLSRVFGKHTKNLIQTL